MSTESHEEEGVDGAAKESAEVWRPPNKKQFDRDMEDLQRQIREKEALLEQAKSASAELRNLRAGRNETFERRKQILDDLDKVNREIQDQMRQLHQLESSLIYKSEDKINTAIQRLEWNLTAQRFKLSEEKKIVTEIDRLKRSKRTLAQWQTLRSEVNTLRDRQRHMREERDKLYSVLGGIKAKEEKLREIAPPSKSGFSAMKKGIDRLYEQKRQMVSDFKKSKEEYSEMKEKQKRENWRKKNEERMSLVADRVKERAQLEAEKSPYEEELRKCNALIHHLNRHGASSLDHSMESLSPASSQDDTDFACQIGDGQYVLLKKPDGETEDQGLKRGGKKNRKSRKQSLLKKVINHTPDVLEYFQDLKLEPPATTAEAPDVLALLRAKKVLYERGDPQISEASSDAGVSATESLMSEMSRQASKTESCEETTNPGDSVMADLLKGATGGDMDGKMMSSDDLASSSGDVTLSSEEVSVGPSGTGSDNSDTLSPNSDATGEAEEGSWEEGGASGGATAMAAAQPVVRPKVLVSPASQLPWSRVVQGGSKPHTGIPSPLQGEIIVMQDEGAGGEEAAKRRQSWRKNKERESVMPRNKEVPQSLSLSSSFHGDSSFSGKRRATPTCEKPSPLTSKPFMTPSSERSPGAWGSSPSKPPSRHLPLAQRQSLPATLDSQTLNNQVDFPPLSTATTPTTAVPRRNSSLSMKSSDSSSHQVKDKSTPPSSISSQLSDQRKDRSHSMSSLPASDHRNPANPVSQMDSSNPQQDTQAVVTPGAAASPASARLWSEVSAVLSSPQDNQLPVSVVSVDKLSTEKWVESSLLFTKDLQTTSDTNEESLERESSAQL